jgi:hypothetical protein
LGAKELAAQNTLSLWRELPHEYLFGADNKKSLQVNTYEKVFQFLLVSLHHSAFEGVLTFCFLTLQGLYFQDISYLRPRCWASHLFRKEL